MDTLCTLPMPIEIDPNTDSDPIPVQPDTNEAAVLEVLAK
ncbi:MAG: hypothetical protein ACI9CA_000042, partial [Natronomonas sp.]